jgi:hypothetical protein
MRGVISLLLIIYLIGIGVVLAPTIEDKWSSSSASDLASSVMQALPNAAAWPVTAYHRLSGR